jgi:phospholipid transport system substrate-binding protein
MRTWRRAVATCCVVLAVVAVTASRAPAQTPAAARDPGQFISGLGTQVVKLISDTRSPAAARKQQFAGLVDSAFDVEGIARFILGPYWRTASDQQRSQFEQAFKAYMINVYWSDFSRYSGQQLRVTGQRAEGANSSVVSSEIEQTGGKPPVKVDWRVVGQAGGYKITDVSVAGVSELITYRQEFSNVIAQAGGNVDSLIARLRQKNQQIGGA